MWCPGHGQHELPPPVLGLKVKPYGVLEENMFKVCLERYVIGKDVHPDQLWGLLQPEWLPLVLRM